jgi:hypothetical protein
MQENKRNAFCILLQYFSANFFPWILFFLGVETRFRGCFVYSSLRSVCTLWGQSRWAVWLWGMDERCPKPAPCVLTACSSFSPCSSFRLRSKVQNFVPEASLCLFINVCSIFVFQRTAGRRQINELKICGEICCKSSESKRIWRNVAVLSLLHQITLLCRQTPSMYPLFIWFVRT